MARPVNACCCGENVGLPASSGCARRDRRRYGQQTTAGTRSASPEAAFWWWSSDVFLQRLDMQQRREDG
jgi:hypothetical protein